jgi:membrane protein required for colicin V production
MAFLGWQKGFVFEVLSTLGLVVAVICGVIFHANLKGLVASASGSSSAFAVLTLSFLLTCALAYFLWYVLAKLVKTAIHLTALGFFDNVLGSLLGVLKAALAISFLVGTVARFIPSIQQSLNQPRSVANLTVAVGSYEKDALLYIFPLAKASVLTFLGDLPGNNFFGDLQKKTISKNTSLH